MAGNQNSGGIIAFKLSEKALTDKIEAYKAGVADGTISAPCPSDFYAYLGYTTENIRELMGYVDKRDSAYYNRANAIKNMISWCRNQLNTHPYWGGRNLTKSIFLLKQDWGDGVRYADQDAKAAGPALVKVDFGGGDPRARKARK